MSKYFARVALLVGAFALSGCAMVMGPVSQAVKMGESVPDGKVLVLAKIVMEPEVHAEVQGLVIGGDELKKNLYMILTKDMSRPIKREPLIPSSDERIIAPYKEYTAVAMEPGVRYVRMSMALLSTRPTYITMTGAKGSALDYLYLYDALKIVVPKNAKAVYIGTLVFKHDGEQSKGVQVRDDFNDAMRELAARKIPGVSPKDLVRSIATVVPNNIQK